MKTAKRIVGVVILTVMAITGFSQIQIGSQEWSLQNLNVGNFRNGDPIFQAQSRADWVTAGQNKQPAWCYYEFNIGSGPVYGKLYNWYAVNDSRGLAPAGWHVPTDAEWTTLSDYLGGWDVAGTKLKSTQGWAGNGNGTNQSGFTALPGGSCDYQGFFRNGGLSGWWWTATNFQAGDSYYRILGYNTNGITRNYIVQAEGYSIRCIKD